MPGSTGFLLRTLLTCVHMVQSVAVAPFIINYSGCIFREYPGPWQVMLRQDTGEYACIAERRERYNLAWPFLHEALFPYAATRPAHARATFCTHTGADTCVRQAAAWSVAKCLQHSSHGGCAREHGVSGAPP